MAIGGGCGLPIINCIYMYFRKEWVINMILLRFTVRSVFDMLSFNGAYYNTILDPAPMPSRSLEIDGLSQKQRPRITNKYITFYRT